MLVEISGGARPSLVPLLKTVGTAKPQSLAEIAVKVATFGSQGRIGAYS